MACVTLVLPPGAIFMIEITDDEDPEMGTKIAELQ